MVAVVSQRIGAPSCFHPHERSGRVLPPSARRRASWLIPSRRATSLGRTDAFILICILSIATGVLFFRTKNGDWRPDRADARGSALRRCCPDATRRVSIGEELQVFLKIRGAAPDG
jgi:hypothetical protein